MTNGNLKPLTPELQAELDVPGSVPDGEIDADEMRPMPNRSETARGAPNTGGVLAALRRSPLVGADLDLSRPRIDGRKAEL